MTVEVKLTADVFKHFCYFDALVLRKAWRSPAIFASILSVSAVICYIMHHVEGAVFLGSVLLLVGLGMPLVYFTTFFSSVKKQCTASGLSRPQHVYTLELTDKKNGIAVRNEKEQAEYSWKQVFHLFFRKDAAYLYITPKRAFILPYSAADMEELYGLAEKMLPKEKISK